MKGYYCYIVFVGQQGMKFNERRIGMVGNELSDFLFVRCYFIFPASFVFFGGDVTGFTALLTQEIDPRGTDALFFRDGLAGKTTIAIFQHAFL